MKFFIILYLILFSSFSGAEEMRVFNNKLLPFTSNGCSSFPDSFFNLADWGRCCVKHDLEYWVGGTSEDRLNADLELETCVGKEAFRLLGTVMKGAVRIFGLPHYPTSSRWGDGWVINRGYRPIGQFEEAQILEAGLPYVEDVEITSTPMIQEKLSVTGDYCEDASLSRIAELHKVSQLEFKIFDKTSVEGPEGITHKFKISTDQCSVPYEAEFLLLRRDACITPMNELLSRGRIRLKSVKKGCQK